MINSLKKAVKIIVQIAHPEKIILFGSRARGNHTLHSDYDLIVLKKSLRKQRALTQKIYLNFKNIGAPVDVIVTDLRKYQELKNDPYQIYMEADKNGRVIYEKS